jgi:HSP20 family protein
MAIASRRPSMSIIPVNIFETDSGYIIEASLPGIKPEDVKVTAVENTVTIRVGPRAHAHHEEGTYLRRERIEHHAPEMARTITLPSKIDAEKVTADYEFGVLTLRLGKSAESKVRTIPLHVTKVPVER